MGKLVSGRVKKLPQSGITSDRYEFLGLTQAEPDLGDPLVGVSSVGAKPKPISGDVYILAAYSTRSTTGVSTNRYWVASSDLPQGLTPGSFTVFNNNTQVGLANSFNKFNFVGTGVTVDQVGATAAEQTGIATIRISVTDAVAKGEVKSIQFHGTNGLIQGADQFFYNSANDKVGIGTSLPRQRLDIIGNVLVSGVSTFSGDIDANGNLDVDGQTDVDDINVAGVATFASLVDINNNVSIQNGLSVSGVTTLSSLLDVNASVTVSGFSTFSQLVDINGGGLVANTAKVEDLTNNRVVIVGAGGELEDDADFTFDGNNFRLIGFTTTSSLYVSGITTIDGRVDINDTTQSTSASTGSLVVDGGVGISKNLNVDGKIGIGSNLDVVNNISVGGISTFTGISTFASQVNFADNIRLYSTIIDGIGNTGTTGQILQKVVGGTIEWKTNTAQVSAAGTIKNIQYHDNTGQLGGEDEFVYDFTNNRVGIGTSVPNFTLDVRGDTNIVGVTSITGDTDIIGDLVIQGNLSATGVSTLALSLTSSLEFGSAYEIRSFSTTVSSTSLTTINTLGISTFRSAKYQIQITQGTDYQATDVLVLHNGTNSNIIEYGSIATNDYLGQFSSQISGSDALLQVRMVSSGIATITMARHALKVV